MVAVVVKLWQPVARLSDAESRYEDKMSPLGSQGAAGRVAGPVLGSH